MFREFTAEEQQGGAWRTQDEASGTPPRRETNLFNVPLTPQLDKNTPGAAAGSVRCSLPQKIKRKAAFTWMIRGAGVCDSRHVKQPPRGTNQLAWRGKRTFGRRLGHVAASPT